MFKERVYENDLTSIKCIFHTQQILKDRYSWLFVSVYIYGKKEKGTWKM